MTDEPPQAQFPDLDQPADADPTGPTDPPPLPVRRLRRRTNGWLGGVASGVADYFRIDPAFVRIAFVVLAVAGGSGFLIYLAAWILVPDQRSRDPRPVALNSSVAAVVFGGLVLVGAVSVLFDGTSFALDGSAFAALLLVAGGFSLLNQRDQQAPAQVAGPPPPHTGAPGAEPTHWALPIVDEPVEREPRPPITSVTLGVATLVAAMLLVLGRLTSLDIGAAAFFGTFAAVCGVGLVASAFVGRALPLIPIGLLALAGLAASPIADASISGGFGPREYRIDRVEDLKSSYEVGAGYIELDLSDLRLTGDRTVEIDVGAGYAEVIVPADLGTRVDVDSRFGYVRAFGKEQSGVRAGIAQSYGIVEGQPTLTINAKVVAGYVELLGG